MRYVLIFLLGATWVWIVYQGLDGYARYTAMKTASMCDSYSWSRRKMPSEVNVLCKRAWKKRDERVKQWREERMKELERRAR